MPVRVAIVGVGNCANSLVQGLSYYANSEVPEIGLVRPKIGPYSVKDIEVVAAFDVNKTKVGTPLQAAIWAKPNDTFKFAQSGLYTNNPWVQRGPTLDGIGRYLKGWVEESDQEQVDVFEVLKENKVDVVINYLPVGSQEATEFYVIEALKAGCGFVNCIPVFVASNPKWENRFKTAKLPIVGDDIKSQVGATIVHRVLARLFKDRGVKLDRTMQLNVGGNNDFLNMLERERLDSKKVSKTEAVVSISGVSLEGKDVHIGPSDYVEWLGDRKWAYIRMEGRGFGGAPLNIEMKLEVWDSPNSAGIVIDAVRIAKLAMDRGEGGCINPASTYFMKHPPVQIEDGEGLDLLDKWISGE